MRDVINLLQNSISVQESEAPVEKLGSKTVRGNERMIALIFFEIHRPEEARNFQKLLKSNTLSALLQELDLSVSPDIVMPKYLIFNAKNNNHTRWML